MSPSMRAHDLEPYKRGWNKENHKERHKLPPIEHEIQVERDKYRRQGIIPENMPWTFRY